MAAQKTRAPADYMELIRRFPLLPIKHESHLRQAEKMLDALSIIDDQKLTEAQAGYLEVLTDLVERYEEAHHRVADAFSDGIDALHYLLEQHGMSASDLGRVLGNRQLGAAVLRRQRQLSKGHISKLAAHFSVSTDLFMNEHSAATAA